MQVSYNFRKHIEKVADVRESVKRNVTYLEIAAHLRQEIREGKLKPGTPVLSSRALARAFGVSLSTAHKAANCLVREALIYRRQGSGTFVNTPKASPKGVCQIGCAIRKEFGDMKIARLLSIPGIRLANRLRASGCHIRFIPADAFADRRRLEPYLKGLDGLLISCAYINLQECAYLHDLRLPVVLFQGDCELPLPFHQVLPDHMIGMRDLFSRARQACFQGVIVIFPDHANGYARRDACIMAAKEYGFMEIEGIEAEHPANFYKLGLELSRRCSRRLIVTCTDLATFDLIHAFHDVGLEADRDYHLVGYDDVEGIGVSPLAEPTVTALSMDRNAINRYAEELLFSEIRSPSSCSHIIRVPTKLIIRKTAFTQ